MTDNEVSELMLKYLSELIETITILGAMITTADSIDGYVLLPKTAVDRFQLDLLRTAGRYKEELLRRSEDVLD
jgi:hypothetical protein